MLSVHILDILEEFSHRREEPSNCTFDLIKSLLLPGNPSKGLAPVFESEESLLMGIKLKVK